MGLEIMVNDEMKKAVFYGDAHFDKQSDACLEILYDYLKQNSKDVTHVIDVGDGIDNPFMSTFPVDPEEITSAQDQFDMYAKHWKKISDLVPKSSKYIMPGNHDKGRLENAKNLNRGLASLRSLKYENILKEALKEAGIKDKKYFLCNKAEDIPLTKNNTVTIAHGDPRLNPYVKGGVTGIRRTAEMYPNSNHIIMGHGHRYILFPRNYEDKNVIQLGTMADIKKLNEAYLNHHPYNNGFGIMHYDTKKDKVFWEYIDIK